MSFKNWLISVKHWFFFMRVVVCTPLWRSGIKLCYLKIFEAWKQLILDCSVRRVPSGLPLWKIPWKVVDQKRNFVILEIFNLFFFYKKEEISFVILTKLRRVGAVSINRSFGYWWRVRHIFISSLIMFIQHVQPIKGYLWIIVARIIVGSTVNN